MKVSREEALEMLQQIDNDLAELHKLDCEQDTKDFDESWFIEDLYHQ